MAEVSGQSTIDLQDYAGVYDWSIRDVAGFWDSVWRFTGVIGDRGSGPAFVDDADMLAARFFPDVTLNFAENLLRRRDDEDAIVFWGEDRVRRRLSYNELYQRVAELSRALTADGVGVGDRVAGFLPNCPEAVIAMLATASIGAIWSSCSPDFGAEAVLDRFGQIGPKILLCADGYFYGGKRFESLPVVRAILPELPSVKRVLVVPYVATALGNVVASAELDGLSSAVYIDEYARHGLTDADADGGGDGGEYHIEFSRGPFTRPLYILYSSGTTGKPKCIIHGAGGTLLQHLKEHQLLCDIKKNDRVFYFTTCGWMMWNWLVSALASEATLLLYDGSPFHPDGNMLFHYMESERGTLFGVSAKYIDALAKSRIDAKSTRDLAALRTVTSTGSPLMPEGFDYVYEHIKDDVCLSSISGGTDIVSCFVAGDPTGPVWRGEIQARGLGMAVEVFDDQGTPVRDSKGELVCTRAFPSMPVAFWNDPEQQRYRAAYFARFPGVWCHGDYAEITEHGGLIIYGRSDATLNPGGVRIGTAEIYRQVEGLDQVLEAIAVAQEWEGDQRIVLFVRLKPELVLDEALIATIKSAVRIGASPRHVPQKVLQVSDIPRTKSGKITELAVREVIHGRPVQNQSALANPKALAEFSNRPELSEP